MKKLWFVAVALLLGTLLGLGATLVTPARPASAHPLGNFSVNQLAALSLYPDRIEVGVVVDIAELPTLQERSTVDGDGNGTASDAERATHAQRTCAAVARDFEVSVTGNRLMWTVRDQGFGYEEGAAGLATSRLTCQLTAPAALGAPATVVVANRFRVDRVGWREMIAVGHGVRLPGSPLPARSISGDLRAYPPDLLSSPLDVRSATLRTEPGGGDDSAAGPVGGPAPRGGSSVTGWLAGAERVLRNMVGDRHLTPLVGVLAVLLALVLGAAHAALPGHGKTVMAAYLAGKHGRPRDAFAVGATVTLTHTGGVLILGLLLTLSAGFAGETVLGWLGVVSGALVAVVGAAMLVGLRRRRGQAHDHDHDHGHGHGHGHHHHHHGDHDHHHHGDHDHDHGRRPSRLGIVGMGIAGGLVPSPSALVILLGAVGLGRTGFGVLLVIGYGLGMAATLTAAGLLLIRLQRRLARRAGTAARLSRLAARLSTVAPTATAGLVLLVGLGLAGRALAALA